jgi:tetratricopeptide (TPR) repeat protein
MVRINRRASSILILFGMLSIVLAGCRPSDSTTVEERMETIKTYPFSEPDPVPILTRSSLWGRGAKLYPYYFFDKFSKTAVEKDWKVIRMENPYIEVSVLPEVGGKVWGAAEKSTGHEFIYKNHVMKFREIALRGPWTSGGIEFNFGIVGHTPSTATPVDYLLRKNLDGSVSCVVGALDLPSRTRWSVTIRLPKDKAYFETKAFWYNPSPFHQSYYSWMNAAIKATEDLQYVFPGTHHIGHDFSVPLSLWPVDEQGRDLSWYKNNDFGSYKSYFTVGEYENFFGGYWHNSRFGFGHWALYDDVPGHKIWIWGLSRQGMIWEDLLTDTDGQYSEPQAGRYFNQSDHGLFIPYAGDSWREIWFPYKEIGPLVKASPLGVLNVDRNRNYVKVSLYPLQKISDDLVLRLGGKEIFREHLNLETAQVFTKDIPLNIDDLEQDRTLDIEITKNLTYSSNPEADELTRPIRFHPFDETTAEGIFLSAKRAEQERNYYTALEQYLKCLEMDPLHTRALSRVAEIYCRRGEYKTALFYAHRALLNEMYDPEANYIYGIVSRRQGNNLDAIETLGWAARSLEYRSSAYSQMAEIYFTEKDYDSALDYVDKALAFNTFNINTLLLKAMILRINHRPFQAQETLAKVLEIEPLNHLARYELYLLRPNQSLLDDFRSMIRNELPHETYIELALHYVNLGLNEQAVELLKFVPDYPTAVYWLAYLLREENLQQSRLHLDKAQSLSPWLVFPFREESIPVFEWAIQSDPADWKAKYYLALIFWSKGRIAEAQSLFDLIDHTDFAPFYLARGHFYKTVDLNLARADFERAVENDEKSWKNWSTLIDFYLQQGLSEEALASAQKASELFPEEDVIKVDMIRSLMTNDRYEEAAKIIDDLAILPYEGASDIHGLFVLTHVHLGLDNIQQRNYEQAIQHLEKAKTYPENLGSGQPYEPDQRMQDFLIAYCYEKMGERNKAEEIRQAIFDQTLENPSGSAENLYFGGLALVHFGQRREGRELMRKARLPEDFLRKIRTIIR